MKEFKFERSLYLYLLSIEKTFKIFREDILLHRKNEGSVSGNQLVTLCQYLRPFYPLKDCMRKCFITFCLQLRKL